MTIYRRKYTRTDGIEREYIEIGPSDFDNPETAEQFGHDLLRAAAEWQAEIEVRGPPGAPAYKVFEFVSWVGGRKKIASWIEHPWALIRRKRSGALIAFLVKAGDHESFNGWIVFVKFKNHEHQWKCRYARSFLIEAHDIIHVFPHALPDSPTLGELENARVKALASEHAEEGAHAA